MTEEQGESGFDDFENESRERRKPRKSARDKVMDLLARRDHSELELKRKLAISYSADEIADAIRFASENRWMKQPEELARTVASQLDRRGKGMRYIQRFLRSKGLPTVGKNATEEVAKALALIEMKLRLEPPFNFEAQKKIGRLLKNRGYDDETIGRVIHEKS